MALKRRHEGVEMMTSDKLLTRFYDSDKEKSEIDSDIGVLKIRQRLMQGIRAKENGFTHFWVFSLYSHVGHVALCNAVKFG